MQQTQSTQNIGLAAIWMLGAVTSFATMAVAGRTAMSAQLDTFELLFYRSLVSFSIVLCVAVVTGKLSQVRATHMRLHLARNVAHFTGQNLWFYALTLIPLAQVFALEFTSPLWVIVLAAILLGETITRARLIAGLLGFIGVMIITRPGATSLSPGTIAAALSAICFAATAVATKRLTRDVSVISILFWLTVIQAALGLICAGIDGEIALPPVHGILPVILVGICGLTAHFCLTTALSVAPSGAVMSMDFTRLPVIAVVGMLLYSEPLEWAVFAGAALILLGNLINLKAETR